MKKLLSLLSFVLLMITATAQVRISDLPSISGNPATVLIPAVEGGVTKKASGAQLRADLLSDMAFRNDSLFYTKNSIETFVGKITSGGGGISGSGTTGYLQKWTGATASGNSLFYENSGKIGLGTLSPTSLFNIRGNVITNGGVDLYNTATDATAFRLFQYSGAPYRVGEFVPKFSITYNNALAQNLPDSNGNYTSFIGLNEHDNGGDTAHGVIGLSIEGYYRLGGQAVQELHLLHNFKKSVGGGTRFLTFAGRENGSFEGLDLAADVIGLNNRNNTPKFTLNTVANSITVADSVVTTYNKIGFPIAQQLRSGGSSSALPYYDSTGRHLNTNTLDIYQDGGATPTELSAYAGIKLKGSSAVLFAPTPVGAIEIKNTVGAGYFVDREDILILKNGISGGSNDSSWRFLIGKGNQFSAGELIIGSGASSVTAANYSAKFNSDGSMKLRSYLTTPLINSFVTGVGDAVVAAWTNTGGNFNGYYAAGARHGNAGSNGSDFRSYIGSSSASNFSVRDWSDNVFLQVNSNGKVGIGNTSPNSKLDVSGSFGAAITTTSTNITLDATHHTVIITGSTPTITLPAAASGNARTIYRIVNQTGAARTISSYLDFAGASATTVAANSAILIHSNGTSWYRIQ